MSSLLHPNSLFRMFSIPTALSIGIIVAVWYYLGVQAALLTMVLSVIELTFSFDNAIVNARVLTRMSRFWQQAFMTIGILIAIFGMRIVFPIVIVMLSAQLSWWRVIDMALHQPEQYAAQLHTAHPSIAAFGGMFLLMLALDFFFDEGKRIHWIKHVEQWLQNVGQWWMHAAVSLAVLMFLVVVPFNEHPREVFVAGLTGIVTYIVIHGLSSLFLKRQEKHGRLKQAGLAGLASFLYLEVLDASFSLDGVIGAFAITNDVVIIAAGLGIGALWVRSLTVMMVRRRTLETYRFLEHGAHYTIGLLASMLLVGLFINIPEAVCGIIGVLIISASVASSMRGRHQKQARV